MRESAVKQMAKRLGIYVFDMSARHNSHELIDLLHKKQIDGAIVFAYGEIISAPVLSAVKKGFFNVHPSLLPKFRGPNPICMPLLLGEHETGITLIRMDEHMDTGDIVFQKRFLISPDATLQSVLTTAIPLALEGIMSLIKSGLQPSSQPQNSDQATYTQLLQREDGYIPAALLSKSIDRGYVDALSLPVYTRFLARNALPPTAISPHVSLYVLWKALHPWPGIWTAINHKGVTKRLKILLVDPDQLMKITQVQLEGKKQISWGEFLLNYSLQ